MTGRDDAKDTGIRIWIDQSLSGREPVRERDASFTITGMTYPRTPAPADSPRDKTPDVRQAPKPVVGQMPKLSVRVPDAIMAALDRRARQTGQSASQIVRSLLARA